MLLPALYHRWNGCGNMAYTTSWWAGMQSTLDFFACPHSVHEGGAVFFGNATVNIEQLMTLGVSKFSAAILALTASALSPH